MTDAEAREIAAWEVLRYLLDRRLAEPTPERKAIWFYRIEVAREAFLSVCAETGVG